MGKRNLQSMPVQKVPCLSCPFAGRKPVYLEPKRHAQYVENLVNCRGQHLCHSADNRKICRGGRDILLRVLAAQGLLPEATDTAFNEAMRKALTAKATP